MRGEDRSCGGVFSYIDLEARVSAEHPLRPIRDIMSAALATLSGDFAAVFLSGATIDPAGKAAVGNAVAGLVFGTLGALVDRADRIRPADPAVCRHWNR
jgi:hypothetical protein